MIRHKLFFNIKHSGRYPHPLCYLHVCNRNSAFKFFVCNKALSAAKHLTTAASKLVYGILHGAFTPASSGTVQYSLEGREPALDERDTPCFPNPRLPLLVPTSPSSQVMQLVTMRR